MGYSAKTDEKNFSWSKFWQVEAGAAIGGAEIAVGVALTIATDGAALPGLAAAMLGTFNATVIGAGFSGVAYSALAGDKSNWTDFGINQLVGAAAGLITGVFGGAGTLVAESLFGAAEKVVVQSIAEATDLLVKAEEEITSAFGESALGQFGVKAGFGAAGGFTSSMGSRALGIALGTKHTRMFSGKEIGGDFLSLGLGILGPGLTGSGALSWGLGKLRGWKLITETTAKTIPRIIDPLVFNSKKLFWSEIPQFSPGPM